MTERFEIIDKRTREEIGSVWADNQEGALRAAAQMWPASRVEAMYQRPPMNMTKASRRRVKEKR